MSDDEAEIAQQWYDRKSILMEQLLGSQFDMVSHSLIPFSIGGALDLYYYPNCVEGTAIATKELSEVPGEGSSNSVFECYELVMFTKHALNLNASDDKSSPFGQMHATINSILNPIARYSATATLEPNETCEFPEEMETIGGRCLIFDAYPSYDEDFELEFGMLAVIEIFRSEMEFARKHGGVELLNRLKKDGYYPYSDLDRKPVA